MVNPDLYDFIIKCAKGRIAETRTGVVDRRSIFRQLLYCIENGNNCLQALISTTLVCIAFA